MLSHHDFKTVVTNAPLFAIDLVVLNAKHEILLGLRKNAPAQGFWFVPGGRVYKGETQQQAFARITKQELGTTLAFDQAAMLGVYDHFYDDSIFGSDISTHYINTPYLIHVENQIFVLPQEQHRSYRWQSINTLERDSTTHKFSKIFLPGLINILGDASAY